MKKTAGVGGVLSQTAGHANAVCVMAPDSVSLWEGCVSALTPMDETLKELL